MLVQVLKLLDVTSAERKPQQQHSITATPGGIYECAGIIASKRTHGHADRDASTFSTKKSNQKSTNNNILNLQQY